MIKYNKRIKMLIGLVIIQALTILFIINKYETQILKQDYRIVGGVKRRNFTAIETLKMIKSLPNYLGDSLIIYEDGSFKSLKAEVNGGIESIYNSPEQLNYFKLISKSDNLPLPFVVYRNIAPYYFKPKK